MSKIVAVPFGGDEAEILEQLGGEGGEICIFSPEDSPALCTSEKIPSLELRLLEIVAEDCEAVIMETPLECCVGHFKMARHILVNTEARIVLIFEGGSPAVFEFRRGIGPIYVHLAAGANGWGSLVNLARGCLAELAPVAAN